MTEEVEPHITRKYDLIQKLGKGAYGIVWKAIDRKTREVVALKKVFDAFHNATDAQRTFREVMFLQEINGHENIVRLLNILKAENNKDIYLVFEFMETDLHAVIRANILQPIHKQYIMYQILKALKFIHSGELIHRDLKPSNILLNSECHAKLADFGLARSVAFNEEEGVPPVLTEYVATRWYRAPEILLGSVKYTKEVDMWSVGCILGELIIGKAIFPGTSTMNQIERVLEIIGKPSQADIDAIESSLASNIINNITITTKKKGFEAFFPNATEVEIDFLKKTLVFNPRLRMSAEASLKHPYVREFSDPEEEIVCERKINITMNDNKKFSIKEYREALYADITRRKKEQRKKWQQKYLAQLGVNTQENSETINNTNIMFENSYFKTDKSTIIDRSQNYNDVSGTVQNSKISTKSNHLQSSQSQPAQPKPLDSSHNYNGAVNSSNYSQKPAVENYLSRASATSNLTNSNVRESSQGKHPAAISSGNTSNAKNNYEKQNSNLNNNSKFTEAPQKGGMNQTNNFSYGKSNLEPQPGGFIRKEVLVSTQGPDMKARIEKGNVSGVPEKRGSILKKK